MCAPLPNRFHPSNLCPGFCGFGTDGNEGRHGARCPLVDIRRPHVERGQSQFETDTRKDRQYRYPDKGMLRISRDCLTDDIEVQAAAQAGLAGLAIEPGRVMILERDKTLNLAEEAGLFLRAMVI